MEVQRVFISFRFVARQNFFDGAHGAFSFGVLLMSDTFSLLALNILHRLSLEMSFYVREGEQIYLDIKLKSISFKCLLPFSIFSILMDFSLPHSCSASEKAKLHLKHWSLFHPRAYFFLTEKLKIKHYKTNSLVKIDF